MAEGTTSVAGGGADQLPSEQTISIMQACEVAGVSRRTIYNWMEEGKLTIFRTPGGSVRLLASELVRRQEHRQDPRQAR